MQISCCKKIKNFTCNRVAAVIHVHITYILIKVLFDRAHGIRLLFACNRAVPFSVTRTACLLFALNICALCNVHIIRYNYISMATWMLLKHIFVEHICTYRHFCVIFAQYIIRLLRNTLTFLALPFCGFNVFFLFVSVWSIHTKRNSRWRIWRLFISTMFIMLNRIPHASQSAEQQDS